MKIKANQTLDNKNSVEDRTTFYYYAFRNILLVGLPLVLISAFILSRLSLHSSALESSSDKVNLTIPVSCNLTATIPSGKEHTISMVSGTYEDEIGQTILKTSCNDANGYAVYAIGNTDNTEGKNVLSTMIGSTYDIPTGTATSGDTSAWAMKLSPIASSNLDTPTIEPGYSSYHAIPSTWTKVVSKSSSTNMSEGSSFSTTYAIYLKNAQPAGTYRGQVKYVMFHPSTAVAPTDTIEHAFAAAGKQKITIYDDNGANTTESTNPTTGENNTLIGSFYKMQDIDSNICNNTTLVDEQNTLQLVDIRDYKIYWVTKLQDGHCWMTQNLDLDLSRSVALTSLDTDLNDNSLTGAYSLHYSYDSNTKVITWTPENTTRNYSTGTGTAWSDNQNKAYSLDPGEWYWDGNDNTPNCNYFTTSCDHFSQAPYSTNSAHGSVGNYYNWSAAIASDNSSSLTADTGSDITKNPQNSICPKGWRLPTISSQSNTIIGSTNEFSRLNILYNENKNNTDANWINEPPYFTRVGYYKSSLLNNAGSEANYLSSITYNSNLPYSLRFSVNSVETNNFHENRSYYGKAAGRSLRCLARTED